MAWVKTAGTPGTPGYKRSVSGEAAMSPSQAEARGFHWVSQKESLGRASGKEAPTETQYREMISLKRKRGDYPQLSRVGVRGPLTPDELSFFSKLEQFRLKYPRLGPLLTSAATLSGLSAIEQQKIMQEEIEDVKRIESEYIKSGELVPTHKVISPSDIGEIAGVYKEEEPPKPTPRLDYTYVGTRYETLTKEYDEYTRAREKQEELYGASVWGKYARLEERGGEAIAKIVSSPTDIKMGTFWEREEAYKKAFGEAGYGLTPEQQARETAFRKSTIPQRVFGAEQTYADYARGILGGIREKPIKTIVTGVVFAALPPVLKGAKYAFKPVAKVGVKAFPLAAPWVGKWTPRAVAAGLAAAYGGSVGYQVYKTPPEQRAYEFGKITGTEILPMGIGTAVGLKALTFRIPSVPRPSIPKVERPTYKYEGTPTFEGVRKPVVWEVPDLVPRRGTGGRDILMGKKPYVPKVEPYKYEGTPTFEGFEKPARGRIEIAEGKSRLEIIKEISETTDIARIKALEAKLEISKPVSRRGQPVEDWGKIWKQREVETSKRIKAGELQVQEMAGGELGLLQITKTVKAPKIKTIAAARTKQAQYQEHIQKQIQKQRAFVVPIYMQKPVQIQKEIAKKSQIYEQQYKFAAVQVAAQKSFEAMKEEAEERTEYVGISVYKVPSVQVPKVPSVQVPKVPSVQVPKMVGIMEYAPGIKYKVPVVHAVMMSQPPIVPLFLYKPQKKKKKRRKRKYKREPYAWIVKNPIPTMRQMMTIGMNKAAQGIRKAQAGKPTARKKKATRRRKK